MTGFDLILLLIAIVGSALYSGLETGVVSVNRMRLQHLIRQGEKAAERTQRFVEDPDLLLGTTLAGTNLCNVIISVVSAQLAVAWLGGSGLWVASLGATVALLIFGEYLPKAWFRSYPAYRVMPFSWFLTVSAWVFSPLSSGIMKLARWIIPSPSDDDGGSPFITREELAFLAREGEQTGELTSAERRMMHGVLALSLKTCKDVMIPRDQMISVRPSTAVSAVLNLARKHRISRLPIYDESLAKFTGFINIMDLLIGDAPSDAVVRDYARPPQYVRATDRIDRVLPRMRLSRQPLALVHDEQERVIGLVSVEDIMEEIIGEM